MRFLNRLFHFYCVKIRDRKRLREILEIKGTAVAFLTNLETGESRIIRGKNIVCTPGARYYAQMCVNDTVDNDFTAGGCKLGTGTTTPSAADTDIETVIAGSYKALKNGYPKVDDGAGSGGGPNTASWAFYWEQAEAVANNISECAIVSEDAAPPAAILNHALFDTPFNKSDKEPLTVFVNHTLAGV